MILNYSVIISKNEVDENFGSVEKFPVFHWGPRTCLGKDMTFMVAAIMIYNYNIQLMEAQTISPTTAIVIRMTNDLKVRLSKRVL